MNPTRINAPFNSNEARGRVIVGVRQLRSCEKIMTNELTNMKERLSIQTDEDLLKIVNIDFADYREEAIKFAKEELEQRGYVLSQTGVDFKVMTPEGIRLTSPKGFSNHRETVLFSNYDDSAVIPNSAYILAGVAGVFVPLIVTMVIFLPISLMTGFSLWLALLLFVLIISTYAALGILFARKWIELGWNWGLWITVPAIFLSLLSRMVSTLNAPVAKSSDGFVLLLGTTIGGLIFIVLPACVGAYFGARMKRQRVSDDVV